MSRDYWLQQPSDKPLFPDLLWSRPENKNFAGKLLIVGGNSHGFAAPAEAVAESEKAGIGSTRILLPQSVKRLLPPGFLEMEFASTTPSGSFARQALAQLTDLSAWADGVLLTGDFGKNSETAILLETYLSKYSGQLTITKDAFDLLLPTIKGLIDRVDTLLVGSFSQLQKLGTTVGFTIAFTSDMGALKLIDTLHDFTQKHQLCLITKYEGQYYVAIQGQVSTTKAPSNKTWCVKTAAHAATWWLQNPSKPFEALTTSVSVLSGTAGRT